MAESEEARPAFGLRLMVLGEVPVVEISEGEFQAIESAHQGLADILGFEERLNVVLENYEEFEAEILRRATHHMLFFASEWSELVTEIHSISRRLINLLSTCRLYFDATDVWLSRRYGKTSARRVAFREYRTQEFESHLAYRMMEQMRNYAQHFGTPIWRISRPSQRHGEGDGFLLEYGLTPYVTVEQLRADGKFNKKVLEELAPLGDHIDVRPFVREYIASFGRIHKSLRFDLKEEIAEWDEIMNEAATRYEAAHGSTVGLSAARFSDRGTVSEQVPIFRNVIHRRRELEAKNMKVTSYARLFVSSRPLNEIREALGEPLIRGDDPGVTDSTNRHRRFES